MATKTKNSKPTLRGAMPDSTDEWDFCDRSPCTRLLSALGEFIFGDRETGGFVMCFIAKRKNSPVSIIPIRYCPYCGTRLSELKVTGRKLVKVGS